MPEHAVSLRYRVGYGGVPWYYYRCTASECVRANRVFNTNIPLRADQPVRHAECQHLK